MGALYAYVRISTLYQNEDRQTNAMQKIPIPPDNIYAQRHQAASKGRDRGCQVEGRPVRQAAQVTAGGFCPDIHPPAEKRNKQGRSRQSV